MITIKMKGPKNSKVWLMGIVAVLIILMIVCIGTFSLFDDEVKELVHLDKGDRNCQFKIYYIPSNATVQSYIQIRKLCPDKEIETIASYERYQQLVHYQMMGDSVKMIIKDTISYKHRQDTVTVLLK
ncbi:hypothetical protein QNI16_31335 [Cytophagaceae bacterium YF14B1]|uniref:Uncharacterized protein n=1 Tax=Xanthocytophaga flava TaxID=3048013 RepID=A0AAE3QYW0_9BACT|nr:hypothetical protein [Xanthocytophaga flavus]MDJ1485033.1 hypothetical protein [Xanthocytophaga flavus]